MLIGICVYKKWSNSLSDHNVKIKLFVYTLFEFLINSFNDLAAEPIALESSLRV